MTEVSEEAPFPEVKAYIDGKDRVTPAGYFWMKLPDVPSLAALFSGGGADSRALACDRCGSFVALTAEHDSWHAAVSS